MLGEITDEFIQMSHYTNISFCLVTAKDAWGRGVLTLWGACTSQSTSVCWDFDLVSEWLLGQQALGHGLICLQHSVKAGGEGYFPLALTLGQSTASDQETVCVVSTLHQGKMTGRGCWISHGASRVLYQCLSLPYTSINNWDPLTDSRGFI